MAKKPNIRFAGFEDDWEQRKFSELYAKSSEKNDGSIGMDRNITVATMQFKEDVKVSTAEYLKTYYTFNLGDIAFEGHQSKEFRYGRFVENDIGNGIVSHIFAVFRPIKEFDLQFWKYAINNEMLMQRILSRSTKASTMMHDLVTEDFLNEIFLVPSFNEQKQIGTYLKSIDHLITLHQRKCDELKKVKKFMLQKMFPKKGEKNPEIRFDGFTNDWEQRKLGEVCVRVTRKNKNNESDLPLTIASQYGLIDQRDFFNKVIAAKDMSNYYLLKKGEFAYNKSYSKGFDYGSIKRLNAYEQGCLSTLYICFSIETDEVDSDYLECFFDTLSWYHDVSAICAEGARNHGLLNVDVEAFFKDVNIEMPSQIQEQRKISVFINTLDHLITLHQRKCEELKNVKKYMLQNMFAKGE